MAGRKSFLLRIDAAVLEAMQRWANDDLRSLNGQIEYVLRDAVRRTGRTIAPPPPSADVKPDEANDGPSDSSGTPDSTDSDRQ